jgi:hypothetical protein
LTGTPVTKGPEDVFSQFKFLDPYILGYESFYSFRARYCIMGGFEQKQIVGYEHVDELIKMLKAIHTGFLRKTVLIYRIRSTSVPMLTSQRSRGTYTRQSKDEYG